MDTRTSGALADLRASAKWTDPRCSWLQTGAHIVATRGDEALYRATSQMGYIDLTETGQEAQHNRMAPVFCQVQRPAPARSLGRRRGPAAWLVHPVEVAPTPQGTPPSRECKDEPYGDKIRQNRNLRRHGLSPSVTSRRALTISGEGV